MGKKIVICSDGTWNKRENGSEKNTNIARLFDALVNDNPDKQVTFYDAGVGTGITKLIGGATGLGISKNIKDCYQYLVEHYNPGDQIFLFGFSRGAYTVRSLAGFIYGCGILQKQHKNLIDECYGYYRNKKADTMANIKKTRSRAADVHMIGVWDTVGALGIPLNTLNRFNPFFHKFHDTVLNPSIKYAYHALAIDEPRKTFCPNLWDETKAVSDQTIEQVWFAGAHSDVGGGYKERGLSDITLEWMISKARHHNLQFRSRFEAEISADAQSFLHNPREGMGKLYRKTLRDIAGQKQSLLFDTVPERVKSEDNRPDAEYRPKNLSNPDNLEEHYVVVGTDIAPDIAA